MTLKVLYIDGANGSVLEFDGDIAAMLRAWKDGSFKDLARLRKLTQEEDLALWGPEVDLADDNYSFPPGQSKEDPYPGRLTPEQLQIMHDRERFILDNFIARIYSNDEGFGLNLIFVNDSFADPMLVEERTIEFIDESLSYDRPKDE